MEKQLININGKKDNSLPKLMNSYRFDVIGPLNEGYFKEVVSAWNPAH
jgi:hypothetical protein